MLSKPNGHYTYRQFNIQQFYVLPTQCVYVFCVDLRTNSDYFPIQYCLTGFFKQRRSVFTARYGLELHNSFYQTYSLHRPYRGSGGQSPTSRHVGPFFIAARPSEICGGQSGTATSFPPLTYSPFPSQYHSTTALTRWKNGDTLEPSH